jgi:hypothetical protein
MAISREQDPSPRITIRCLLLGTFGGTLISAFAAYNDWAMNNTFLIGNNMPVGAIMLAFFFVVFVNGPLSKWWPNKALSSFETAVAFMVMLAMCAIPTSGLIRYLLPNLVMPFSMAADNQGYSDFLSKITVSRWVFPDFNGARPVEWIGDTLATSYNARWLDADTSPYGKWITPFISWGLFFGALFWALICVVCIILRQWRDTEHLPFPLAHVQLSIIESPARGRWFNDLLGKRSFWIAFAAVFLLHLNNGLFEYFPKYFVQISRGFDLQPILSEDPWRFTDVGARKCVIYFSVIAVTYFLNSPVAFSLWFFYVLMQLSKMILGMSGQDTGLPGLADQTQGVSIAFFLSLLWIGRRHWRLVIAQAFRGEKQGEDVGTWLSYRAAFWGVVGGIALMIGWLCLAGSTFLGAIAIVAIIFVAFILITRIVAETGLIHGGLRLNAMRPFTLISQYTGYHVPPDTYYLASLTQATVYDYREVLPVYFSHGAYNVEETIPPTLSVTRHRQIGRKLIAWLCISLAIGYSVSYFSALYVHYNYAVSMDVAAMSPLDTWGQQDNVRWGVLEPNLNYARDLQPVHSPAEHFSAGFGIAAVLSYLRLRFAWWPLHPIGYLLLETFPSSTFWFSIFLGWLLKIVLLRFGSVSLYRACRPACIGMLVGESIAAGFWLVASIVLNAGGYAYRAYYVLPQ